MNAPDCSEVRELAAELALDLLTGAERAAALAHLAGCPGCRAEVASLTDVGEAVLGLASDAQPSVGFETRVVSRITAIRDAPPPDPDGEARAGVPLTEAQPIGAPPPASPTSSGGQRWSLGRRGALVVAAAVVAGVVGIGAGLVASQDGSSQGDGGRDAGTEDTGGDEVAADLRTGDGEVVGRATLRDRGDDPALVTVEMGDWVTRLRGYGNSAAHSYWLTVDAGGERDVYALPVTENGPWHVTLDGVEQARAVTAVAVVDETGHTWCGARFSARSG